MAKPKKTILGEEYSGRQCSWRDNGYQCQNEGHLAQTVHGGGPWYCRAHFATLTGRENWKAPNLDMSQKAIDERVNKIVPRLEGESEHDWSMRCRTWVLARIGKLARRMREPGEDEYA